MLPDQISHFPVNNLIASLPMFLFHQASCFICLASMIPTLLTPLGDFIANTLLSVSDHIEWRPIPLAPQP